MADAVRLLDTSGSPERVAYDLMYLIRKATMSKDEILDLYAECLEATKYSREVPSRR